MIVEKIRDLGRRNLAVTPWGARAFKLSDSLALRFVRAMAGQCFLMTSFDGSKMPEDGAPDEQVSAFFRRYLPDFYFVNTPLSRMRRHLQLLRALPQQPLQIEFHGSPGAQFTELMLCGYDAQQPGLLAQVAGALSSLGINVHTAWIHTLHDPHAPDNSQHQVVLNTLILSESSLQRAHPLTQRSRESVEATLRQIIGTDAPSIAFAPLPLMLRELSVMPAGRYTLVKVLAANENGALHIVAQAIASLGLDIAHAQINTFENAVADTFFVTDAAGEPLPDEEDETIAGQLRAALE